MIKKTMGALSPNTTAASLMIVAVLFFSFMDATAKGLSADFHSLEIIWARYFFQILFTFMILAPRLPTLMRTNYITLQLVRSLFLFGGTMGFFFSIGLMPLANATAIFEVAPLFITVLAFFILKEQVGIRRFGAVIIGLIGAVVIIRPGTSAFSPAALLPLFAAACFAGYTISTRFLGQGENQWTSFIYTGLIGTILASVMVPVVWVQPTTEQWLSLASLGAFGMVGHLLLIRALFIGEASYLAPFAYCSLAFNALWGFLFYNEVPDIYVIVGAVIIIGAGVFIWRIETKAAQKALLAQPRA